MTTETDNMPILCWSKWYGCSHNQSDSEVICGLLADAGYQFIGQNSSTLPEEAQVAVIVSCTVKGPSEAHFYTLMRQCLSQGKLCLLAGCVVQQAENRGALPREITTAIKNGRAAIIGVQALEEAPRVLDALVARNGMAPPCGAAEATLCTDPSLSGMKLVSQERWPGLSLPRARNNPFVEILPVQTGCLGACTYCQSRLARGRLHSYPQDEILAYLDHVYETQPQTREVWFAGEDVAAWGADIGLALPDLLMPVLERMPATCRLRVGMSNPLHRYWLRDGLLERWIECYKHPRMFAFAHIPVQSGSDNVLKNMQRGYTRKHFDDIISGLRAGLAPARITLSTDIICGFSMETDGDHEETMDLLRLHCMPVTNTTKFYPRPGTAADKMPRVPTHIQKKRSLEVTRFLRTLTNAYDYLVGETVEIALTEISAKGDRLCGRTKDYVQVLCAAADQRDALLGKFVRVKITAAHRHSVEGQIVDAPTDAPVELN